MLGAVAAWSLALVASPAGAYEPDQQPESGPARLSYPAHASFGRVAAGGETTRRVVFTNVGDVSVTLGPVGIFALGRPAFGMASDDCGGEVVELAPGGSCAYVLRFAPPATSGRTATHYLSELRFGTSAGPASVRLTGGVSRR